MRAVGLVSRLDGICLERVARRRCWRRADAGWPLWRWLADGFWIAPPSHRVPPVPGCWLGGRCQRPVGDRLALAAAASSRRVGCIGGWDQQEFPSRCGTGSRLLAGCCASPQVAAGGIPPRGGGAAARCSVPGGPTLAGMAMPPGAESAVVRIQLQMLLLCSSPAGSLPRWAPPQRKRQGPGETVRGWPPAWARDHG